VLAAVVAVVRWQVAAESPFATVAAAAWATLAGALELAYFLSLGRALERGPLGPVYTISRGGAVVLVYPLSMAIFAEQPSLRAALGSAIVVAGLVLSGSRPSATRADPTHAAPNRAIAWALACAASIAGYHLAYKAALDAGGNPSAVFAVALGVATAVNYARTGADGRRAVGTLFRTRAVRIAAMGILCGSSFLILMEALSTGQAGFVLTLRNTSVLFATVLAWAIGEPPTTAHTLGAALVAAGAIAMAT
jgi:uncharacterized membrane protein